jgi:hypothetical protein
LVFTVLAGVAEKWHDRSDALGTGAAGGIHHDQQLHDVVIRRRATRLNDENICSAHVFVDFDLGFTVRKSGHVHVGKGLAKIFGDAKRKGTVSGSTDDFHIK